MRLFLGVLSFISVSFCLGADLKSFEDDPYALTFMPTYNIGYFGSGYSSFYCFETQSLGLGLLATHSYMGQLTNDGPLVPVVDIGKTRHEYVQLPDCHAALFGGSKSGEYYAISSTAVFYQKPGSGGWQSLFEDKDHRRKWLAPAFGLNTRDQVVVWEGYEQKDGLIENKLEIWGLKNKEKTGRIHIGMGYEGMSGFMFLPSKKQIVLAAIDSEIGDDPLHASECCAKVRAYDYSGKVVHEYAGIDTELKQQGVCLYRNGWWKNQLEFYYRSYSNEYTLVWRDGSRRSVFTLNLETDKAVKKQ